MRIEVQEEATRDLAEGYWFYERQQPGLRDRFVAEMWRGNNSLPSVCAIKREVYGETSQHLTQPFPWKILFEWADDTITVVGVCDCRRDPDVLSQRFDPV